MTALFYLVLAFTLAAVFISGWAFGINWERGRGENEQRGKRFPSQPILGATLRKLDRFVRRRAKEDEDGPR